MTTIQAQTTDGRSPEALLSHGGQSARPAGTISARRRNVRTDGRASPRRAYRGAGEDARPTVLVVEDEPSIGGLVSEVLEEAGYSAALAPDGRTGLAMATDEHPALVITDRLMPEIGGVELVRRLRENPATRDLPVALMSSTRPSIARAHTASGGVDGMARIQYVDIDGELVPFLPKPFDLDELVGLVAALAPAHEARDAGGAQASGAH